MKESKQNSASSVVVRVVFEGLYIGSLVFTVVWALCLGA